MSKAQALVVVLSLLSITAAGIACAQQPRPSEAQIQEAKRLVADVYKGEYAAAKTAGQKQALALKLLTDGRKSKEDPASQYALFEVAKTIAADAGDVNLALQALEELERGFELPNASETPVQLLLRAGAKATLTPDHYFLCRHTERLWPELLKAGDFTSARTLAKLADGSARKLRDLDQARFWTERAAELDRYEPAFAASHEGRKKLATEPADAEANLAAGKYSTLYLDDWSTGLSMLALSSHPDLQPLAERELRAPTATADQVALAEDWHALSTKFSGIEQRGLQRHAVSRYQAVLPALTGLTKTRIDKVLAELSRTALPDRVPLSSLRPTRYRVWNERRGPAYIATVAGRKYYDSIWAHPPTSGSSSIVDYALPCEFKYLTGFYALDSDPDSGPPRSHFIFRMNGSSNDIWRIKAGFNTRDVTIPFRIDTRGHSRLELIVDCPGDNSFARVVWIDPILVK